MATTGKLRSNALNLYINTLQGADTFDGTVADDTWEIVASSTSATFTGELETIDATSKDEDGARKILVSATSWSIQAEGLVQYDDTTDKVRSAELFTIWNNKTKVRVAWSTGKDGDTYYWGDAYLTSYEETAGLNEVATYSVTLEGDGAINTATVAGGDTLWKNTQYVA